MKLAFRQTYSALKTWPEVDRWKAAFGIAVPAAVIIALCGYIGGWLHLNPVSDLNGAVLAAIILFFIPAFVEELVFRGLLIVAIYVKHVCPTPQAYRGTVILLATLVVGWRTAVLFATGFIDLSLVVEAALLLPAIVLGGIVGTWFYRKLTTRGFFLFFQLVILFSAMNLLWQGLRDLL